MADTVPTAIVGARGSTATLTGKAVKTFTFTRFSFAHTFTRAFNLLFVVVVGLWCGGPCVSFGASTWLKGRGAGVKERNNVNLSVDLQLIISFKKRKNESWRQGRAKRSTRGTTWAVMLDDLCGGCAVATVVLEGGGPNIFFSISNSFFWIGSKWVYVWTVFLCGSLRC